MAPVTADAPTEQAIICVSPIPAIHSSVSTSSSIDRAAGDNHRTTYALHCKRVSIEREMFGVIDSTL